jgi:hypothetical protein
MPLRTTSFAAGALGAALIFAIVGAFADDDPWDPADVPETPAAADREPTPSPEPRAHDASACPGLEDTEGYQAEVLEAWCADLAGADLPTSSLTPVEHAELRATWVAEVCVPATGDPHGCSTHARSEAWPWTSDDPLGELAATYATPGYCDGLFLSDEGRSFCESLAAHYRS